MYFKDPNKTFCIKKEIKNKKFEIDFEKLKKKELEILKNFIDACNKMNLTYFITYGTLIGAIRHKGFIPWDDDIDVCMPRGDYETFIKNGSNFLDEKYFIQTIQTDPLYALNFAKLRDSNTTLVEKHVIDIDINHGVFIDIFPLDGYEKGKNKMIDLRVKNYPVFAQEDKNKIFNAISDFNQKFIYKIGETIPNKLKTDLSKLAVPKDTPRYEDCKFVSCIVDSFSIIPIEKEVFSNGTTVDFENLKVNAPKDYDKYLKKIYGDYMKLPPKGQRENHHNFHICDTERSFRYYEEILKK